MTKRSAVGLSLALAVLPAGAADLVYRVSAHADAKARAALGVEIEDYGSFVVIAASAPPAATQLEALAAEALPTTLHGRGFVFDPLDTDPLASIQQPGARFADLTPVRDFVVQFDAPIRAEWLQALRAAGLQPVQYLPHQAWLVHGEAAAALALRTHPRVRHVGAWEPAFRLAPALGWALGRPHPTLPAHGREERVAYDLALAKAASRGAVEAGVLGAGGSVLRDIRVPGNYFDLLRVELPPSAVLGMAHLPGVIAIDPWTAPQAEDERAALIVAGRYQSATELDLPGYDAPMLFGVDGTNVTVAVSDDGLAIPGDGGFYLSFFNANHGPMRGATYGANGHGHLQGSIIAGSAPIGEPDSLGYNFGLGIAPGANLVNIPILRAGYSGTEVEAASDAVSSAGPNGVRASILNNSWGGATNANAYDAYAGLYDGLVRDASLAAGNDPVLIVFSAGNRSLAGLTRPKVAKNVISVGASENLRPELDGFSGYATANNLDELAVFSSRGPAADGRIKPDIVAPGDAVTGGRGGPNALSGNIDLYHRYGSGTSHAAPQIAGAAALFTQAWKLAHAGSLPSPAMVKAALLNGTVELTGDGAEATIPNGAEGWGRVNLSNVLGDALTHAYLDQGEALHEPSAVAAWDGRLVDGDRELRIALVWTDAPGLTDPALVNDLDLEVEIGGVLYRGNVFAGGSSVSGGARDTVNNVEKLLLPAGIAAGTPLRIRVRASALNGDGVPGNAFMTDQDFALVCSNCEAVPGFTLDMPLGQESRCVGDSFTRTVSLTPVLGFAAPVSLSVAGAPASGQFSPNPIPSLPGTSTLTLQTATLAPGASMVTVNAVAGAIARSLSFPLFLAAAPAAPPEPVQPDDAAVGVGRAPLFSWQAVPGAFDYRVEISSTPDFATLAHAAQTRANAYAATIELASATRYYWRVFARNACPGRYSESFADGFEPVAGGASATPSVVRSFTTAPLIP